MSHIRISQTNATEPVKFVAYKNPALAIKVQHPIDWTISAREYGDLMLVEFNTTKASHMSILPPTVLITVGKLPTGIKTLDNLTRLNIAEAKKVQNFRIIESNGTTLSGLPAHKITYTYTSDPSLNIHIMSMDIWTIKYDKRYTFSYLDTQAEFLKELPIIKKIVNSFQIE